MCQGGGVETDLGVKDRCAQTSGVNPVKEEHGAASHNEGVTSLRWPWMAAGITISLVH